MNDLQKKEFELLKLFVDICEQLDLTYYLVCGSALGAVKYNGFIPWDDDIDIVMFHKDYKKIEKALCNLESDEFVEDAVRAAAERAALRELLEEEHIYAEGGMTMAALDIDDEPDKEDN
jgi:phosphorylcholine metabolism protein LicD